MSIFSVGTGFAASPTDGQTPVNSDPTSWDPLVAVTVDENGEEHLIEWLGPQCSVTQPVNALPTAELPVILAEGWLVNTGTAAMPVLKRITEVLPDDLVIVIRTSRSDPGTNFTLFVLMLNRCNIVTIIQKIFDFQ